MGNAHDSDLTPTDQGAICVQRERRAEDLPQDAWTDLQYAFKDGWDKPDLEYIHKHRCFLLIICIALTPWAWEVSLEGRKGGPQD